LQAILPVHHDALAGGEARDLTITVVGTTGVASSLRCSAVLSGLITQA